MKTLKPLRLLSWNILEGWHLVGRPGDIPQFQPDRLAAAQALVAKVDPDIVVLNEALWCRPFEGRFVDYAALLGFDHAFCDTYDGAWGNAILSRLPFEETARFRIHNRGGLRVRVEQSGWPLTVVTYHPHPGRYASNKAADYNSIVPRDLDHPLVVCGDFNAISPDDKPDEIALTKAFSRFSLQPAADLARFTDGGLRVFDALQNLGLRDAVPLDQRNYTMPTNLLSKDKASAMRIDHAWVNDRTKVVSGIVLQDPLADIASDHYPLVIDVLPTGATQ